MKIKFFSSITCAIIRIGVSLSYLFFGFQHFVYTHQWIESMPNFIIANSPLDSETLVHFSGAIEIVFGLALLLGVYSRASAVILTIFTGASIVISGFNNLNPQVILVLVATLIVAFNGYDVVSLGGGEVRRLFKMKHSPMPVSPILKPVIQANKSAQSTNNKESILDYIKKEKANGVENNLIYNSLVLKGWTVQEIDKAFQDLKQNPTV